MSKKIEQTSFPPSSAWDQLCVIEQSAEVADRWDIKPHWHNVETSLFMCILAITRAHK